MNYLSRKPFLSLACLLLVLSSKLFGQVPQILNYQGRVVVSGTNFEGTGYFKFALVSADGAVTYWSNDGTPSGAPASVVTLSVTKGLYSVVLGDASLPHMTAIPPAVFNNTDLRLRVWFDDGTAHGSQLLTPDTRIAAVAYAVTAGSAVSAATVTDGAITSAKLAPNSVDISKLAPRPIAINAVSGGIALSSAIDASTNSNSYGTVQNSVINFTVSGRPVFLCITNGTFTLSTPFQDSLGSGLELVRTPQAGGAPVVVGRVGFAHDFYQAGALQWALGTQWLDNPGPGTFQYSLMFYRNSGAGSSNPNASAQIQGNLMGVEF